MKRVVSDRGYQKNLSLKVICRGLVEVSGTLRTCLNGVHPFPFSSRSQRERERERCLAHKCFSVYCVRSERHLWPSVCKMAARDPLSRGVPFFHSKEKIVPLFVQGMHFVGSEHACWINHEFWNSMLGWVTVEFDVRIPSCMVDLRLASRSQCGTWVLCTAKNICI